MKNADYLDQNTKNIFNKNFRLPIFSFVGRITQQKGVILLLGGMGNRTEESHLQELALIKWTTLKVNIPMRFGQIQMSSLLMRQKLIKEVI
jgi:hypothetical protein